MMKFDMHIHCNPEAVNPAALLAQMDQCGISGGVLMSHYPKEYKPDGYDAQARMEQVLAACREHPDRLFPVLWIHPHEPDVLAVVEEAAQRGILGFKIICNNFYVSDPESKTLLRRIAELNKPVIFHSGILWDGGESSKYNRPLHWESLVDIKGLRFSLGHCSWPWIDECIALYGKFLNAYTNGMGAEMFFDTTAGTPTIYRRELLEKLYLTGYDVVDNVMFGTDCCTRDYNAAWAGKWLELDGKILRELGADEGTFQKLYQDNLLRFLGLKPREFVHVSPVSDQINNLSFGTERPCAGPIRHAREEFDRQGLAQVCGGSFEEYLLPVLDAAYALYCADDASVSGDARTDLFVALLRSYRNEDR